MDELNPFQRYVEDPEADYEPAAVPSVVPKAVPAPGDEPDPERINGLKQAAEAVRTGQRDVTDGAVGLAEARKETYQAEEAEAKKDVTENPFQQWVTPEMEKRIQRRKARHGQDELGIWFGKWGLNTPEEKMATADRYIVDAKKSITNWEATLNRLRETQAKMPHHVWINNLTFKAQMESAQEQIARYQKQLELYEAVKAGKAPGFDMAAWRSAVNAVPANAINIIAGSTQKMAGIVGAALGTTDKPASETAVYKWGEQVQRVAADLFPQDPARQEDFVQKAAQAGGSMIAFSGSAFFGKVLGLGYVGTLALVSLLGGAAEGSQQYETARAVLNQAKNDYEKEHGKLTFTEKEAIAMRAAGLGFLLGLGEAAPFGLFLSDRRGGIIGRILSGAIGEATQEGSQHIGSGTIRKYMYDPKHKITEGLQDALIIGAMMGGGTSATFGYSAQDRTVIQQRARVLMAKARGRPLRTPAPDQEQPEAAPDARPEEEAESADIREQREVEKAKREAETAKAVESDTKARQVPPVEPVPILPPQPQEFDVAAVEIPDSDKADLDKVAELTGLKEPGETTERGIARLAEEREKGAEFDRELDPLLDLVVQATKTRVAEEKAKPRPEARPKPEAVEPEPQKARVAPAVTERGLEEVRSYIEMLNWVRETKGRRRPETLTEYVRDKGGVRDTGGDLRQMAIDEGRRPFQRNIIQETGETIDDMANLAFQAGFFDERPTVAEFLDALGEDAAFQNLVRLEDQDVLDEFMQREEMVQDLDEVGIKESMTNAQAAEAAWQLVADEFQIREHEAAERAAEDNRRTAEEIRGSGALDRLAQYIRDGGPLGADQRERIAEATGVDESDIDVLMDEGVKADILREHGGQYFRAVDSTLMPATTGQQIMALQQHIGNTVRAGGRYNVRPHIVKKSLDVLSTVQDIPAGVTAGAVEAYAKMEYQGRPVDVALIRLVDGGQRAIVIRDLDSFLGNRAMFFHDLDLIVTNRVATLPDFRKTTQAEVRHELVHARYKRLSPVVQNNLFRHAQSLDVMSLTIGDYLRIIGDPVADVKNHPDINKKLFDIYSDLYEGMPLRDRFMAEEFVAHMIELNAHDYFTAEQMAPIAAELGALNEPAGYASVTESKWFRDFLESPLNFMLAKGLSKPVAEPRIDPLGYFSGALKAADNLQLTYGPPEQMLAELRANGAKDAEISATGLDLFMLGQPIAEYNKQAVRPDAAADQARLTELGALIKEANKDARPALIKERKALSQKLKQQAQAASKAKQEARQGLPVVTKSGIVAFLELNRVPLREHVLRRIPPAEQNKVVVNGETMTAEELVEREFEGARKVEHLAYLKKMMESSWYDYRAAVVDIIGEVRVELGLPEHEFANVRLLSDDVPKPKWAAFSPQGDAESYQETLVALPSFGTVEALWKRQNEIINRLDVIDATDAEFLPADVMDEYSALEKELTIVDEQTRKEMAKDFRTQHWHKPNVVVHIRASLHPDAQGNIHYVIGELQSDWGQELRELGDEGVDIERLDELKDRYVRQVARAEDVIATLIERAREDRATEAEIERFKDEVYWAVQQEERLMTVVERYGFDIYYLGEERLDVSQADLRLAEWQQATQKIPTHPLVRSTDQWAITGLRRALRKAIEQGADYIAIASGQTVDAYGMGAPIDGLKYAYDQMYPTKLRDLIYALDPEAANVEAIPHLYQEGATPAKIKLSEDFNKGITPEDTFTQIPMINRIGGAVQHPDGDFWRDDQKGWYLRQPYKEPVYFPSKEAAMRYWNEGPGFHRFKITDKMREAVMQGGQPMFAAGLSKPASAEVEPRPPQTVTRDGKTFVRIMPYAGRWGDNRDNPADRERALSRLDEIADMNFAAVPWADLVQARRDFAEIIDNLYYWQEDATDIYFEKPGASGDLFFYRSATDVGRERSMFQDPSDNPPELLEYARVGKRILDAMYASRRAGIQDLAQMGWDTEPTRYGGPKPEAIADKMRSGFFFKAGRELANVPDNIFDLGGRAVIDALQQRGVKKAEIAHFQLEDLANKRPATRGEFTTQIAERAFDMKIRVREWNPELPTMNYKFGGTRAADGPRIPGRGVYFERLMAFPKRLRGGERFPAGEFISPHWAGQLENTWASWRGSTREIDGWGTMVIGEEGQSDFMQGANRGDRPRKKIEEFKKLPEWDREDFTPETHFDDTYVHTMVRSLIQQAVRKNADSVAISTSDTTARIQNNPDAAKFYDTQFKSALQREMRRLTGDNTLVVEKVALPRPDGVKRMKPYTVWAAKLPQSVKAEIREAGQPMFAIGAWHGTTSLFDRFQMSMMGTGEGAQVFGPGLYFAEEQATAEFYRTQLAGEPEIADWSVGSLKMVRGGQYADYSPRGQGTPEYSRNVARAVIIEDLLVREWEIRQAHEERGIEGVKEVVLDSIDSRIAEEGNEATADRYYRQVRRQVENGTMPVRFQLGERPGYTYEVEIDVNKEDLLDWHEPINAQSDKIRGIISNYLTSRFENDPRIEAAEEDFLENGPMGYSQTRFDAMLEEAIEYGGYGENGMNVWEELEEAAPNTDWSFLKGAVDGLDPNVETGQTFYEMIAGHEVSFGENNPDAERIRNALLGMGIPGIRYADQLTRDQVDVERTDNIVVFDESLIHIKSINGRPPPSPMAAIGPRLPAVNLQDPGQPSQRIKGLNAILRDLSADLDIPIRQGAGHKKFFGYNIKTGISRQRTYYNLHTFATNLGDALYQRMPAEVGGIILANQQELAAMTAENDPNEGFGMFVRLYITSPATARQVAPNTFKQFETDLDKANPVTLAKLQRAQEDIRTFNEADPTAQLESMIVPPAKQRPLVEKLNELDSDGLMQSIKMRVHMMYRAVVDRAHPFYLANKFLLEQYQQNTGQKLDLKVADNAEKLLRMSAMSHSWAGQDLEHGVRNRWTNEHQGASMVEALRLALGDNRAEAIDMSAGSRYRQFGAYLVARRSRGLWSRYFNGDLARPPVADPADAAAVEAAIQEYEQRFPTFSAAADAIYNFQNNLLELQRDAGLISEKAYDKLIAEHIDYVPFMRSFEEDMLRRETGISKQAKRVIKRFRGSDRDIIDPIASIAQKVYETRRLIALNDAKRAMLRLAEQAGPAGGAIAERIDATRTEVMRHNVIGMLRKAARDLEVDETDTAAMVGLAQQLMGNEAWATTFQNVPIQPGQRPIVWMLEDGKPLAFELGHSWIGSALYETLQQFGYEHTSMIVKMLSIPSKMVSGSVTSHPEFIAANIARDGPLAFMYDGAMVPWYTQVKGMVNAIKGGEDVQRYAANMGLMGGIQSSHLDKLRLDQDVQVLIDRGYNPKIWRSPKEFFEALDKGMDDFGLRTTWGRVAFMGAIGTGGFLGGLTGAGVGALGAALLTKGGRRTLAKFTEASETGTRVELMKAAERRAKSHGLNALEAAQEASYHALDFMDYTRTGASLQTAAKLTAFLRPAIVGLDRYYRSMFGFAEQGSTLPHMWEHYVTYRTQGGSPNLTRLEREALERSVRTWAVTTLGLGSLSALIWAWNKMGDEDEELTDITRQMRAKHWVISLNGLVHIVPKDIFEEHLKDKQIRPPKPFETAWFANLVEAVLEDKAKGDPEWFENYLASLWEIFHPPVEPTFSHLAYGLYSGKDAYTGRDIIPFFDKGNRTENLYGPYTSEFSKWAGPKIGVSPYYLDWGLKGLGTSWMRDAMNVNMPGTVWYDPNKPEKGLDEWFVLRRFMWKKGKGSEARGRFFDIMGGGDPVVSIKHRLFTPYSKLAASAKDYRDVMRGDDPASGVDMLKGFTERERGYAILQQWAQGRTGAKYRMLDPMNRASRVMRETNGIMKEIHTNVFAAGKTRTKQGTRIPLSPREKRVARDILSQYQMIVAHNALVVTEERGWKQKALLNTNTVMAELKAAVPEVHKELKRRLGRAKVLNFGKVRRVWPQVKELLESEDTLAKIAAGREEIVIGRLGAFYARAKGGGDGNSQP